MYAIGDLVIYGHSGVCTVSDIAKPAFGSAGADQLYYSLTPHYQNGMIYTPVDTKVFMRRIISGDEIEPLLSEIRGIRAEGCYCATVQLMTAFYEKALKAYTCSDLARLALSIHAKKRELEAQNRKLGQIDIRFLKKSEDLLFGELAVVLGIAPEDVAAYLSERTQWPDTKAR